MTFPETARDFERDPGPETFAALRADILAAPSHRADADVQAATAAAREAGAPADVVATITAMMPGSFLSPVAHGLLAEAYETLGDRAAAARERALTKLAFKCILDSGDGSEAQPWSVLRISDEYDVLRLLGRSSAGQDLVERGGRRFDRHAHDDGSESWFDVSAITGTPGGSS